MSEEWYVRAEDQGETGPFTEKEIWAAFESGEISEAMQIRQGASGWCSSTRVKQIFEQLQQQGWFVNDDDDACDATTMTMMSSLRCHSCSRPSSPLCFCTSPLAVMFIKSGGRMKEKQSTKTAANSVNRHILERLLGRDCVHLIYIVVVVIIIHPSLMHVEKNCLIVD